MAKKVDSYIHPVSNVRRMRRLTEREKETIRFVWKKVEDDYPTHGRNVFVKLFDDYPYFKKFFKSAIGNFDDPFMSPRFQKHMLQVLLPTFGGIMDNLDFPEAVNEAVKRLAVAHRRKEIGLAKEHIDILGQVILSIIKRDVLDCTEEQEEAMKKVLSIVVGMFCEALEGRTF
ncbi:myoglobin-like [Homalodisca vitripennis]|uniref:myoglobin-like n=1 Tax=Homalodisca vitripennis TaxID=197043 RepID=UPI001EEC3161|nr:myoglobin-like [Homalodisca vitripennis]